ncbi:Lipid II isoglutaminyl synthase (glutamine-hydrolyzing) subunit MurT [Streptomyces hirsutus]
MDTTQRTDQQRSADRRRSRRLLVGRRPGGAARRPAGRDERDGRQGGHHLGARGRYFGVRGRRVRRRRPGHRPQACSRTIRPRPAPDGQRREGLAGSKAVIVANCDDPLVVCRAAASDLRAGQVCRVLPVRCRPATTVRPAARRLRRPTRCAGAACSPVRPAWPRGRRPGRRQYQGRDLRLLLAKNPAGWLETFWLIDPPPTPVILSVNARSADGTATSWLWDVDYTRLTGHPIVVLGDRKLDLAVRLEVANQQFQVCEDLDQALQQCPPGRIEVIANYTAFQDLRRRVGN